MLTAVSSLTVDDSYCSQDTHGTACISLSAACHPLAPAICGLTWTMCCIVPCYLLGSQGLWQLDCGLWCTPSYKSSCKPL